MPAVFSWSAIGLKTANKMHRFVIFSHNHITRLSAREQIQSVLKAEILRASEIIMPVRAACNVINIQKLCRCHGDERSLRQNLNTKNTKHAYVREIKLQMRIFRTWCMKLSQSARGTHPLISATRRDTDASAPMVYYCFVRRIADLRVPSKWLGKKAAHTNARQMSTHE